jgi:hypothetical protein
MVNLTPSPKKRRGINYSKYQYEKAHLNDEHYIVSELFNF